MKKKNVFISAIVLAVIVAILYMIIRNASAKNLNMHLYLDDVVEYDKNFVDYDENFVPTEFVEYNDDIYFLEYNHFNNTTLVNKIDFDTKEKSEYLNLAKFNKDPMDWYILASLNTLYIVNYNIDETYYIVSKNDTEERIINTSIPETNNLQVDYMTGTLYYVDDSAVYNVSTLNKVMDLPEDTLLLEISIHNDKVISRYSKGIYVNQELVLEYYQDYLVADGKLYLVYSQDDKTYFKIIDLETNEEVKTFSIGGCVYDYAFVNGKYIYLYMGDSKIHRVNVNKEKIDNKYNVLSKKNVVYNFNNMLFLNDDNFLLPARKSANDSFIIQLYW